MMLDNKLYRFYYFLEIKTQVYEVTPSEAEYANNIGLTASAIISLVICGLISLDLITIKRDVRMLKANFHHFKKYFDKS